MREITAVFETVRAKLKFNQMLHALCEGSGPFFSWPWYSGALMYACLDMRAHPRSSYLLIPSPSFRLLVNVRWHSISKNINSALRLLGMNTMFTECHQSTELLVFCSVGPIYFDFFAKMPHMMSFTGFKLIKFHGQVPNLGLALVDDFK